MSNEHNFTMTDRQQKREAVEKYNERYVAQKLEREARQKAAFGGQIHLENIPPSNVPIEVSYKSDGKEPIPGTVVVKQDEEELPVVESSQPNGTGRRIAVLGAGGVTPAGRFASRLIRDAALVRAVELIQEKETPKKSIAFATEEALSDLAKQQAREEICTLLIDEGDNKKFTDYLAALTKIPYSEAGARKLRLPSLKDMKPEQVHEFIRMYEDVMREAHGLPKRDDAPIYPAVTPIVTFVKEPNNG